MEFLEGIAMNRRLAAAACIVLVSLLIAAAGLAVADDPKPAADTLKAEEAPTLSNADTPKVKEVVKPAKGPKAGDVAPDFSLMGSDGKMHSLKDYRGKKAVVIAWFPKAFTGGCTIECKSMHEHGDAIRAYDVAYFTASVDDAPTNKKFAESLSVDYPVLSDPDKKVAKAYGVLMPEYGVANRYTFYIGANGKILYVDTAVSPKTAAEDIAARLEALKIPRK